MKTFKKIVARTLLCAMFVFNVAAATPKSVITLDEGAKAPFSGTLLSPGAAAEILVDKQLSAEEFKLKFDYEIEVLIAKHRFALADLELKLKYLEKTSQGTIDTQKEHISFITERLDKMTNPNVELWFGVGVGAGVVIVLIASFALNAAAK
mgnify:CR=1 FL=1